MTNPSRSAEGFTTWSVVALTLACFACAPAVLGCDRGKAAVGEGAPPAVLLTSADLGDVPARAGTVDAGASAERAGTPPGDMPALPRGSGAPLVSLDGTSRPLSPGKTAGPRLAAIAIETPVFSAPDVKSPRLGMLRAGAIVAAGDREIPGRGCRAGYRSIEPLGYVCMGGATMDLEHPIVRASTRRPDHTQKLPYVYGTATRGGPAYGALPTVQDLGTYEPNLASHLGRWSRDKVNGASYGVSLWGRWSDTPLPSPLVAMRERRTDAELPWFLRDGGHAPNLSGAVSASRAKAGDFSRHNGISFVDTLLWEGRRYNVGVDLRLYPADRFRPIRGSDFHGVRIPEDVSLPFAFVKSRRAKKYDREGGRMVAAESLEWREAVELTGDKRAYKDETYLQAEDGSFMRQADLVPVPTMRRMPGWAVEGEKWIDIDVMRQTLVLYEGTKPVYATLVSTGEAGFGDPATTRSTKRGFFRIHTKYLASTMDSDVVGEEFELRDVPYVQYFTEGYALHAAYWHDVFGQPKSHGCINLAPEDARRIFFWTEPNVPAGWHGASAPGKGKIGTVVYVH